MRRIKIISPIHRVIGTKAFAVKCGVSEATVKRACEDGRIEAVKLDGGRVWLIAKNHPNPFETQKESELEMEEKWHFTDVNPLPQIAKTEWEGKEMYTYQCKHPEYGVMFMMVLAGNGKEGEKIINEVSSIKGASDYGYVLAERMYRAVEAAYSALDNNAMLQVDGVSEALRHMDFARGEYLKFKTDAGL